MKNSYLIIDIARCHGCNNCFMACKDEFAGNDFAPFAASQPPHEQRWINVVKRERGAYPMIDVAYLPLICQHCGNAACEASGGKGIRRAPSGALYFDTELSRGEKELFNSCPYGAVCWNEKESLAQKCQLCVHLGEGSRPRCVEACPTGALSFVTLSPEELDGYIKEQGLFELRPELGSSPHVLYKNLHRYTKNFIGGSLTLDGECLEGAQVTAVNQDTGDTVCVFSNSFGDFKADALESGRYVLTIKNRGCRTISILVDIKDESKYLGTIEIKQKDKGDKQMKNPEAEKSLEERRSVRNFAPQQIGEEELQSILKIVQDGPTHHNTQLLHFSVVQDAALLDEMSEKIRQIMLQSGKEEQIKKASTPGYTPLHHAPTVIFIAGDLKADFHVQTECGIAAGLIVSAASVMGLSSCITASSLFMFRDAYGAKIKEIIGIPDGYQAVVTVALGHLNGEAPKKPEKRKDMVSFVR
jgi:Fe-S-cluster-containing dehydrogenase component/nitroreductase